MISMLAAAIRRDADGATAVEYAIMVALIAVVIVLAVTFVGRTLESCFDIVGSSLGSSLADSC